MEISYERENSVSKSIKRILPAIFLIMVFVAVVSLCLQPKEPKVVEGSQLTVINSCATDYSVIPEYLSSGHLLGNGKIESSDGNYLLISKLTAAGVFSEQSILLNDERAVEYSVVEQENGYYLLMMKEKDAVQNADENDGLSWCALVWIDKYTDAITVVDEFPAAGIVTTMEPNDNQLLLSWENQDGKYLSAYDMDSKQLVSLLDAEATVLVASPLAGGVYACGFFEGADVGELSTIYDSYLGLFDAKGKIQDKHDCGQYFVDKICTFGNKIYALAHHRKRPGDRLFVAEYDSKTQKLKNVQTYSMPTIGSAKYTSYSTLEISEKGELQLMFYAPLSWNLSSGLIGAAALVFDNSAAPTMTVRTAVVTRYYTPVATLSTSGESRYCFIDGDGTVVYYK